MLNVVYNLLCLECCVQHLCTSCSVQVAVCKLLWAGCCLQDTSGSVQNDVSKVLSARCCVQVVVCNMVSAGCFVQYSVCKLLCAKCCVQDVK